MPLISLLVFQLVKRSSIIFKGDIGSTISALGAIVVVVVVAVVFVVGFDSLGHAEQDDDEEEVVISSSSGTSVFLLSSRPGQSSLIIEQSQHKHAFLATEGGDQFLFHSRLDKDAPLTWEGKSWTKNSNLPIQNHRPRRVNVTCTYDQ
ncbi:hypothetical protein Tsp_05576 [Trichinella spiralis]|uniref:Uncharacterized protein n=1 Tax=Trichinella spiralis TaxID=6334 RepID=E5SSV2_TRISP|nr:hypothetical protein Tsp_05576 [Trichinella spiralis]KRY34368.1 hypothetical protein T01_11833 [Trichinella spiralis]